MFLLAIIGALFFFANATDAHAQESQEYPYEHIYTITAYYSPIEGQSRYLTGSLEAEKRLNGNGTNGADGTPVFPGMIAAPKTIPFGTKMDIPGVGMVSVHDRGGAIVPAGQRGQAHDRLDIWMGYGDEGLNRALAWGKRTLTVKVYGIDPSVAEDVHLESLQQVYYSPASNSAPQIFRKDVGYGKIDQEVAVLHEKLADLGYYQGDGGEEFTWETYQAVLQFQLDYEIVSGDDSFGAGFFGPQTRKTLERAISEDLTPEKSHQEMIIPIAKAAPVIPDLDSEEEKILLAGNGLSFLEQDIGLGDEGQAVLELQSELRKLNLFGIEPTGYYGDLTAHAVFKFQQSQGILQNQDQLGAGHAGPLTRLALDAILSERAGTRKLIAERSNKKELLAQN